MKSNKRLLKVIILILILIIGVLKTPVYAQNTITSTRKSTNTTITNTSKTLTNTTVNNIKKIDIELESLEIEGLKLEPDFNKNTYQYKVALEGEETSLEIEAKPNIENAKVVIIGNENIIDGQNIITIMVTDSKEANTATYQICVNKNLKKQEELNKQLEEGQRNYLTKKWTIITLIAVLTICILILLILIYKKTNSIEYKEEKDQKKQYKKKNKKAGKHSKNG